MQLGFVLDQSRCIGCHACTVACKSENHVPVGSFRTWVKYVEEGEFPTVKRSFAVLRCNQCSSAPCITICPVRALEKRPDGIVDVDPAVCIGCKSCMQGCPYDALYLNPDKGTAEKCHFCAHRTEQGLAPACAVVCPTEAIVPGDFDDPDSVVSRMKREYSLAARKAEAGTGPNVLYRDVSVAGIDPGETRPGAHLWADSHPAIEIDETEVRQLEKKARARTTYDVAHPALWGGKITGYLFTKSLAAGAFLAGALGPDAPLTAGDNRAAMMGIPFLGLVFLVATSLLLVFDLKRPERFLLILTRPNWSSWLVKGTYALIAYGTLLTLWFFLGFADIEGVWLLRFMTIVAAIASAAYTGWLFEQAKGRVLWMQRGFWFHLVVQAFVAGSALLLIAAPLLKLDWGQQESLHTTLITALGFHLLFLLFGGRLAPKKREEEFARAVAVLHRGPFARRHWLGGVVIGAVVPILFVFLGVSTGMDALVPLAAVLALVGLWMEDDAFVRAGQALPIS